jgi:hypothetical protein
MWGWLESSNLKVTDVDVKAEVSQESHPTDDLVEKILNHMAKDTEATKTTDTTEATKTTDTTETTEATETKDATENTEATDTPSDEEAEWEKELDKKWDKRCDNCCNERYIELVLPRNQALLLCFMYCMNMFFFMYNTNKGVCRD